MGKEYFSTQIKQDLLGYVYTKDLICFQIKKKNYWFGYTGVWLASVSVQHTCAEPLEARRICQILWD